MAKSEKPRLELSKETVAGLWDVLAPQLESKAKAAVAGIATSDGTKAVVTMKRDRNGRPVAMLVIPHPEGLEMQAKDGVLTRAAASMGADVHRYKQG